MKSHFLYAGALVVSLVLVGCGGPPKGTEKATIGEAVEVVPPPETPEAAPKTTAEAKSFVLSEDSVIEFTGYKVVGQHSGSFLLFDGAIELPDGTPESARMEANFEAMSVLTDNDTLTEVMKGKDFFHVDVYPDITFVSTGVEKTAEGHQVTGNLTLRDKTCSINFPADIKVEGDQFTLAAEFTVNRKAWGIIYEGIADNALKEDVLITLDLLAEAE